jgi:hypothetical protein
MSDAIIDRASIEGKYHQLSEEHQRSQQTINGIVRQIQQLQQQLAEAERIFHMQQGALGVLAAFLYANNSGDVPADGRPADAVPF